ncbi:MAG: phospholipase D-like domain-containing protein [Rhodospirillales bacterium]
MPALFADYWPVVVTGTAVAVSVVTSAHAVLQKRDVRAAIGWVGLIWLVPFLGAVLYAVFGVNRIQRRASELKLQRPNLHLPGGEAWSICRDFEGALAGEDRHLATIGRLVDAMATLPLTTSNAITPLGDGEAAFQEMIAVIDGAQHSVGMATYLFDNDRAGHLFAAALERAVARGLAVRVLIDGVGARYSYPSMTAKLRRRGVPIAEFLPTFVPLYMHYANLRNHRKILVVDGRVGFTGGMNIRGRYLVGPRNGLADQDIHFRLEGPVVAHLTDTFVEDWAFCTKETLTGGGWFPELAPAGGAIARGITAGPDEDFERILWAILGALGQAKRRVRIVTPYFLPDQMLITALIMAAMRGVRVDVLMPERNNLRLVQWASRPQLWQLLEHGCRVWATPPPFDHSKLMTVDGAWSLIGSTNWDPRSLRLNFEFNVEVYDRGLTAVLDRLIDAKQAASRPVTLAEIHGRSLWAKLRDGTAWLVSPYL